MKEIKPIYEEDYDLTYGFPDYNGKVILEIGADHGSTACYFFSKGASKVISIEAKRKLFESMVENKEDKDNWIPMLMTVKAPSDLRFLFMGYPDIDLVHMDCEGCEKYLLEVEEELIKCIKFYQIEIHTEELYQSFLKLFDKLGYNLVNDFWYAECPCHIVCWEKI